MRLTSVFSGPFRWLVPLLCMIACCGLAQAQVTTITGKVYSPLGVPPAGSGDPIPNILVYVAQSPVLAFTAQGPGTDCYHQTGVVSGNPLVEALTAPDGSYTLTSANMPNPATVVIQAGKWRRQYQQTLVLGQTNTLNMAMPANQSQGDLPHIAVVTGEADAIECIFGQIGITTTGANSEVTDPTGSGSINLYKGNYDTGAIVDANSLTELSLLSTPSLLQSYDLVMFGCQGSATDSIVSSDTDSALENIVSYTGSGGRIFTTHFEYIWLDNAKTFEGTANWIKDQGTISETPLFASGSGEGIATIDQTYPEGAILATWLDDINASYNGTKGQVQLTNMREDETGVINPPAQSWATANSSTSFSGNPSMQFTFDTPLGVSGTPSVAVAYSNSSTTFTQGDIGDSVTVDVTNNGTTAANPSLTLSIALPGGITATNLADSAGAGGGWTCTLSTPTSTCTRSTSLAIGASDNVVLTFNIAPTATVGQVSLTASISGGGISNSNQCGRVLYNDYHVESPNTGKTYTGYFPTECPTQTALTNTQKFLEFSLYNLSNFIVPSTTDIIEIQGPVTIVWPQPVAISYGTALTSTQLDATAVDNESQTTIPGTFVYTPALGTVLQANTPCPNLSVAFTPTDTTDYASATGTACVQVNPDSTTTTLVTAIGSTTPGAVTPIYYGQIIADTAVMGVTSNNPGVGIDGGNLAFYILPNGAAVGSVVPACNIPITVMNCPASTGVGYNAGNYQVYSAYLGDTNFLPSQSLVYPVVVQPDPTSITLTSSASTSPPGQSITFTATVADTYYTPVSGTIAFYDGTTVLGTLPVGTNDIATYTATSLTIGVHSIKTCFVSAVNTSGTTNFVPGCSAAIPETITLPATIATTATIVTSSLNPSVVGETVTFTATASTTGSFIGIPTGTVNFYDGTNAIGSGILNNGSTTFAIATLAAGLHSITATYVGNSTTAPSTSAVLGQQVNTGIASAAQGFLMTVSPTTFSVGAGSSTTVAVTILDLNNFNFPVTLGCSGLPAEATCTFSSSVISAPGGTTPLTISVNAPHNCGSSTPYFVAGFGGKTLPILAGVVFLFFARRRRLFKGIALAAILCLLPVINGCGGTCTDLGVKPGIYTFTVTGTTSGAVPVTVAVPSGSASTTPGTSQSQTMTMTVTI
jgi:hypothetical protein